MFAFVEGSVTDVVFFVVDFITVAYFSTDINAVVLVSVGAVDVFFVNDVTVVALGVISCNDDAFLVNVEFVNTGV